MSEIGPKPVDLQEVDRVDDTAGEQEGLPYGPEDLKGIDDAASATRGIIESAQETGEPSEVVETDEGIKGVLESSIPNGNLVAQYDMTGPEKVLDKVAIVLDGERGEQQIVTVDFHKDGRADIFVGDELVRPEDVPSVQAVVEQIQADQAEALAEDEESDQESDDEKSPEKSESEKVNIQRLRQEIGSYLWTLGNPAARQMIGEAGVDPNELRTRLASGDVTVDAQTISAIQRLKASGAGPKSDVWRENPRNPSMLGRANNESYGLLLDALKLALR